MIYLGVARCESIQDALLEAGMDPGTPAAIVSHASRPDERRLVTRLGSRAWDLRAAQMESPAIVLVGEVARMAKLSVEGEFGRVAFR